MKFIKQHTSNRNVESISLDNGKYEKEFDRTQKSGKGEDEPITRFKNNDQRHQSTSAQRQSQQRWSRQFHQRQSSLMYQNFFYGYCFCCSSFGHKAVNCKFNIRNMRPREPKYNRPFHQRKKQSANGR